MSCNKDPIGPNEEKIENKWSKHTHAIIFTIIGRCSLAFYVFIHELFHSYHALPSDSTVWYQASKRLDLKNIERRKKTDFGNFVGIDKRKSLLYFTGTTFVEQYPNIPYSIIFSTKCKMVQDGMGICTYVRSPYPHIR